MHHILFPTDFSPRCDAMAPVAAALAQLFEAKLTLFHVMDSGLYADEFDAMENQFTVVREAVKGKLDRFRRDDFAGIQVDRVFKVGKTVDEIVAYAHSAVSGLIVMPTHGRTRFRELLLGSVTAGVLHDSLCPVLTAAHAETAPLWSGLPDSVLCAVDLSPSTIGVLAAAQNFAGRSGASLQVVHVLPPPTPGIFGEGVLLVSEESQRQRAADEYALLSRQAGVGAPFEAVSAPTILEGVLAAQDRYRTGLLVIGRGKAQGVLGRLRTSAHELIRRSSCPVLSV